MYYLQSRYYDPEMGRFISADGLASTGQGVLGNNMFTYCGNNPIIFSDPTGMESRLVGGGIQFEIDQGNGVVGVEIIIYWDVEECNGGFQIAAYMYGGASLDVNDVFLASILTTISDATDDGFTDGTEAVLIALASKISDTYSIGVTAVAIWGDEEFTSTESYEGSFSSSGYSGGKWRAGYAHSEHCTAVSLGGTVVGFQIIPTISVAKTEYWQILEFNIPCGTSTS